MTLHIVATIAVLVSAQPPQQQVPQLTYEEATKLRNPDGCIYFSNPTDRKQVGVLVGEFEISQRLSDNEALIRRTKNLYLPKDGFSDVSVLFKMINCDLGTLADGDKIPHRNFNRYEFYPKNKPYDLEDAMFSYSLPGLYQCIGVHTYKTVAGSTNTVKLITPVTIKLSDKEMRRREGKKVTMKTLFIDWRKWMYNK